MHTDPIVEEVRAARKQVEQDATAAGLSLGDFLRRNQKASAARLVRRQPVYLRRRKTA
ncbi:MAG: hypothetical protein HN919_12665 [Verrucomicrobia bacterium]|jgi:hypothetical protein|nr:hypothetical protein [Verrucomicrobiota bacterium]